MTAPGIDALTGHAGATQEERKRNMPRKNEKWYVVHTYSGYENKVKNNLEHRIESMHMKDKIFEVVVPVEDVLEYKSGKKQLTQKKIGRAHV